MTDVWIEFCSMRDGERHPIPATRRAIECAEILGWVPTTITGWEIANEVMGREARL